MQGIFGPEIAGSCNSPPTNSWNSFMIIPEILGLINQGHELLVFPKMLIDAVEFLNRQ